MPWQWIADNTRSPRQPLTFGNTSDAVQWLAEIYRKSLWADADCQVQVWLEKDALSGVLGAVTDRFDVPLMVSRGYSSVTFLHEAAETLTAYGRPAFVYHLGDHDPSGVDAARAIEQELRDTCVGLDIDFVRLAVLPEQIETMGLPSRPTKASDLRVRGFGAIPWNRTPSTPATFAKGWKTRWSFIFRGGGLRP